MSPVSVGDDRISLSSPAVEMRMQSKWRRISSVMGSHMNRFPDAEEGVCVTGGNTELSSLSYYGQGFLRFQ